MSRTRRLVRLEAILLVAVGGFAGSNLRYFVEQIVPSSLAATLAVNVAGSFALGLIVYEAARVGAFSDRARLVFGAGFLSSFTTYSTFVVDALTTTPPLGVAYLFASYAAGFAAVLAARETVGLLAATPAEEVT